MDKFFSNKQLKLLIDKEYNGNATELSKKIQVSRQALDDYLNLKTAIGMKFKKKLVELGNINPKWLDYGEGEMLLPEKNTEQTISLQAGNIVGKENNYTINNKVSDDIVQDILNIKLYNVPAHANFGALVQFDDLAYSYKPLYVGLKLDPVRCIGLNVVGDSMIDSQITNGSIIIIETTADLKDGDRAVILHNGTMIVKYYRSCITCEIDECPDCKYKFKLYSRNHGEHEYTISPDDEIVIVGKVKLVIQY